MSEQDSTAAAIDIDRDKGNFKYAEDYKYDAGVGLNPGVIDYIVPDKVHIMYDGRIVHSGDKTLALEMEKKGYDWVKEQYGLANTGA